MKRGLLLLPLLALGAVLAVWAFRSEDALDLDPVASAATATNDAGSARIASETSMTLNGKRVRLRGQGLVDFDGARGRMTLDASALLPSGVSKGSFEMRTIDSKVYFRLPSAISGQGLTGGRWVLFDMKQTLRGIGLGTVDPTNLQQDPTQILRLLRASTTGIERAGTATVRGAETTRYTAKLDLRKATKASAEELNLSDEEREQLHRAAEHVAAQADVDVLPIEVFVDDEGRLRRLRVTLKASPGAARAAVTQMTDYYDFGVRVDVEAPPSGQVIDLSKSTGD